MLTEERGERSTTPPPSVDSYADEVQKHADELRDAAWRILARVAELDEMVDRLRGKR